MFELNFDYILNSEYAQLLIFFSALVVSMIIFIKKRAQRIQERRAFRKRQNAGNPPDYRDDGQIQLEFDF